MKPSKSYKDDDCPKCGESGVLKPTYLKPNVVPGFVSSEAIEWRCAMCGYFFLAAPVDAEEYALRERADRVKANLDIVEVIGRVVPLTQGSVTWRGLCPFHQETTPSFHVHRARGFFHCFGCNRGGDVIKFIERTQHLSFAEAVAVLEREIPQ